MTRFLASALLLLELVGCGTDIAQTATTEPADTFACPPPESPPVLPGAATLGGGAMIEPWTLATGEYGVGQGPGVTVAARDGFRLFVNGHLLAESTASLVPRFVPLTLLPGDNVIAVVVTSTTGVPALLLHLDELEREIVSDASFRVSTAPTGDWMLPGFNDTTWASAVDRGPPASHPECRPAAGFPPSPAHWVTPPAAAEHAAFRLNVRVAPVGFGENATGGGSAEPELVTDHDRLAAVLVDEAPAVVLLPEGDMDLRRTEAEATAVDSCPTDCPDEPGKLTYNLLLPDQTCDRATVAATRNERRLRVSPNKTIVGLGRGAATRGLWLDLGMSENVIIRNLAVYDVNPGLIEAGDAISVTTADTVWIDHVTFKWISDGFIDINGAATNVTGSYLRFDGTNPAACLGRHPRANEIDGSTTTLHHSLWTHVNGRAPLVTHAASRVHLYNDVFTDTVGYTVGSGCDAQVRLEASHFESTAAATSKRDCTDGLVTLGAIEAVAGSNDYGAGVASHESAGMPAAEPHDAIVFVPSYSYAPDPVSDVNFHVGQRAGAGARWALPLELD